ncbi:MAG: transcription antiterminator [Erysipelotrichaceae bacterium]|nr:transcription antiterminator [Erysipelotrichaceae bacterium]
MKNNRTGEIIRILLNQDGFITINEIADLLKVSNKTIRNDLELVQEKIETEGLTLIKKTGAGITIEGDEDIKLHLRDSLYHQNERFSYSKEDRMNYLGLKLLYENGFRIFETAEELYVSRATIHKDLNDLEKDFRKRKLKLIRQHNRAVTIEGSEKNIRQAMDELLLESKGFSKFYEMVKHTGSEPDGSMIFEALDLNDDEIREFIKVLEDAKSPYLHVLNPDDLSQIVLMILVMFLRVKGDHIISLSDLFVEELKQRPFYEEARYLLDALQTYYKIRFEEIEARYLQVFLLSLHSSENEETENEKIAKELISFWSKNLNTDLNDDANLLSGVRNYLSSASTRLKHGIGIDNSLMDDIHSVYPNTLKIIDRSSYILKNHLACEVSEEEKGFLTLYLAAALERRKKPLQAALVSTTGEGATQLLQAKIKRSFPEIDLIKTFNFANLNELNNSEYDLILSTEKMINNAKGNVVVINPILYQSDISRLKKVIREFDKQKNDPEKVR